MVRIFGAVIVLVIVGGTCYMMFLEWSFKRNYDVTMGKLIAGPTAMRQQDGRSSSTVYRVKYGYSVDGKHFQGEDFLNRPGRYENKKIPVFYDRRNPKENRAKGPYKYSWTGFIVALIVGGVFFRPQDSEEKQMY